MIATRSYELYFEFQVISFTFYTIDIHFKRKKFWLNQLNYILGGDYDFFQCFFSFLVEYNHQLSVIKIHHFAHECSLKSSYCAINCHYWQTAISGLDNCHSCHSNTNFIFYISISSGQFMNFQGILLMHPLSYVLMKFKIQIHFSIWENCTQFMPECVELWPASYSQFECRSNVLQTNVEDRIAIVMEIRFVSLALLGNAKVVCISLIICPSFGSFHHNFLEILHLVYWSS